jgi:hypothetical protein
LTSVDAWALGALLYEAMAGQAAYQGTCKLTLSQVCILVLTVMLLGQYKCC